VLVHTCFSSSVHVLPESLSGDYGILTSYVAVGISYVGICKRDV
jgi:hypothetical protein